MHWGKRKYQYEDGSYKPGAEGRYYDPVGERKGLKKLFKKKSSADVEEAVKKEKQLSELERLRAQNAKYRAETDELMNEYKGKPVQEIVENKSEEKKKGLSFAQKALIAGAVVAGGVIVYKKFGNKTNISSKLGDALESAKEVASDTVKDTVSKETERKIKDSHNTAKDILKNLKKDERDYSRMERAAEREAKRMDQAAEKEVKDYFKRNEKKMSKMSSDTSQSVKDILNNLKKDNFFNESVEKVSGTVEGTGTSYWKSHSDSYSRTPVKDIIDVEYREVWSDGNGFQYPSVR